VAHALGTAGRLAPQKSAKSLTKGVAADHYLSMRMLAQS